MSNSPFEIEGSAELDRSREQNGHGGEGKGEEAGADVRSDVAGGKHFDVSLIMPAGSFRR
jgi:hypothetical protein